MRQTRLICGIDGSNGKELWSYNGTTEVMVADITPGSGGSGPKDLVVYENKLYFSASDGSSGIELWSFDGITTSLIDIWSGSGGSVPQGMTEFNGKLFFSADTIGNNSELWSYDGTSAVLEADIIPGVGYGGSWPKDLTVYEGNLYFSASDPVNGRELWRYDGSNAVLLADIRPGNQSSSPSNFVEYQERLYFTAFDGEYDKLWSIDGDTIVLESSYNFYGPDNFMVYNNLLYFSRNGRMRSFDGDTVVLVSNYAIGTNLPPDFTIYDGKLFFSASPVNGNAGTELYSLTTPATCSAAFDIYPDPNGVPQLWYVVNSSTGIGTITYEWDWGDGSTSIGANPSHAYNSADYYNICVTISDGSGCSDTYCDNSTYIYKTTDMIEINVVDELPMVTSLGDGESKYATKVYPNPTSNQIRIDFGTTIDATTLNVFNPLGMLIRTERLGSIRYYDFELPEANGLYLMQLVGGNGSVNSAFKVIKE